MDRIVFDDDEKKENPHHYVDKKHKRVKISASNKIKKEAKWF